MAVMTLDLPESFVEQTKPVQHYMPTILQLSWLELDGAAELMADQFVQFLKRNPSVDEVLQHKASEQVQAFVSALLEKNSRSGELSAQEATQLDQIEAVEAVISELKLSLFVQRQHERAGS